MTYVSQEFADEVVCDCSGTTRGKIDSLIAEGVDTADAISRKTGVISGCGACEWDVDQIIEEHNKI